MTAGPNPNSQNLFNLLQLKLCCRLSMLFLLWDPAFVISFLRRYLHADSVCIKFVRYNLKRPHCQHVCKLGLINNTSYEIFWNVYNVSSVVCPMVH